jgi:hypothetical protein
VVKEKGEGEREEMGREGVEARVTVEEGWEGGEGTVMVEEGWEGEEARGR